ncbi:MAG: hypothetical protein V1921_01985 [Candidatus Altiarchaeota archaeon]
MPEKDKIELSRREQGIVERFKRSAEEISEIYRDDPRTEIMDAIIVAKHGRHDYATERITPEPLWDTVFEERICPVSNTPKDILRNEIHGRLKSEDNRIVCDKCKFQVDEKLFNSGRERNNREKKWMEDDARLYEELQKQRIPKGRIDELRTMGEEQALTELSRKYPEEDEKETG